MLDITHKTLGKPSLSGLLAEFWSAVRDGGNPLTLLRAWAEKRPAIRTIRHPHAIRREHNAQRATSRWRNRVCFVCAEPATQEHHIVQIQHGGTNRKDNKVWVCNDCHAAIHPQLKAVPVVQPGAVYVESGSVEVATCPACRQPVLAVRSRLRKRAVSTGPSRFYLNADAQPAASHEYRTTDLHQPHCLNKRGLNEIASRALSAAAKEDVRAIEQPEPPWQTQAVARTLKVADGGRCG